MTEYIDPIEKLVLKLVLVFVTAIIAVFLLPLALSIFDVMPRFDNALADGLLFFVVPISIVFIIIYRMFKIFSS